jgi:hypothetical protein
MATEFGRGGKLRAHTRHKMFELAQVWTPADNAPLGQREGERAGYVGRPKSAHRSPRPRVVGDVPRTRRAIMDSSHTDTQPRPNLSAEPGEKDLAPNSRTETQPRPNITTEHQQEGDARSPSDTLDRGQRNGDSPSNRADQA